MSRTLENVHLKSVFIETLMEEHEKNLLRYIVSLTSDEGIAEDILQETMIRAWKNANTLNFDTGSIRPWLFSVARNLVVDHLRRCWRRPEVAESSVAAPAQVDHVNHVIDSMVVLGALTQLPAVHLEVLKRRYLLGLSINEVSEELGVPPGTVKSQAHHAIEKLRDVVTIGQLLT